MTPHPREREVYEGAEGLFGAELDSYLAEACGEDEALLDRVRRLIENSMDPTQEVSGLLETPESAIEAIGIQEGDVVDGFKIIDVLGQGGFGAVYLAQQREPRRKIALKVIKPGMDSKEVLARFDAERQALAIMDHPGIAKVLHAGATDRGLPYFAMEYVSGGSITEAADQNRLDTEQRLKLMIKVCDAVQHAHSKAVIHRDLKPGNILVSRHDDGSLHPKVIDFGVAKAMAQRLTELTLHTLRGSLVGTPAYMSPEQANASVMDVDTQTDVYALGVILYELLTGRLPFDPPTSGVRKDELAFYERLQRDDPPKPSTRITGLDASMADQISRARRTRLEYLQKHLSTELDWIPLKAMKRERFERYDSAAELRDDIRRYLDGEPILARPDSRAYRVRKFVAKRKVPLAIGGAFMLLLLGALVTVSVLLVDAQFQRDKAEAATVAAEQAKTEAENAQLEEGKQRKLADEEKKKAKDALEENKKLAEDLRREVVALERERYADALQRVMELDERQRPGDIRRVVEQMKDVGSGGHSERDWEWVWWYGRFGAATSDASGRIPSLDGRTVGVHPATGRSLHRRNDDWWIAGPDMDPQKLDDSRFIHDARFHPPTGNLIVACRDGAIREHEVLDGKLQLRRWFRNTRGQRHPTVWDDVKRLRVAPEGLPAMLEVTDEAAVVWFENSSVWFWSLADGGEKRNPWSRSLSSVLCPAQLSASGAGRGFAVAVMPGQAAAYLLSERTAKLLTHSGGRIVAAAACPVGSRPLAVTGAQDGTIEFWTFDVTDPVRSIQSEILGLRNFTFSPDGEWVVAFGGREAALIRVEDAQPLGKWAFDGRVIDSGFGETSRYFHLRTDSGLVAAFRIRGDHSEVAGSTSIELVGTYEDGVGANAAPDEVGITWDHDAADDRAEPELLIADARRARRWRGRGMAVPPWETISSLERGVIRFWYQGWEIEWNDESGVHFEGERLRLNGSHDDRPPRPDIAVCDGEGRTLVLVSAGTEMRVINLATQTLSRKDGSGLDAGTVGLSADGGWLAYPDAADDGLRLRIERLDSSGPKIIRSLPVGLGAGWTLAVSRDARHVALATGSGRVWLADRSDADGTYFEIEPPDWLRDVAGNDGDGVRCEVGFAEWDPTAPLRILRCLRNRDGVIMHADVIGVEDLGNERRSWSVPVNLQIDSRGVDRDTGARSDRAIDAAISPSGRRVAVQFGDGTLALCDADTGDPLLDLAGEDVLDSPRKDPELANSSRLPPPHSLAWSSDGSRIHQVLGGGRRIFDALSDVARLQAEARPARRDSLLRNFLKDLSLPEDYLSAPQPVVVPDENRRPDLGRGES